MAFGIKKEELKQWKQAVKRGEIAFITHFWIHPRFPQFTSVTKAGCSNIEILLAWGENYGLNPEWVHHREDYPHFDLIGEHQRKVLIDEQLWDQIRKFGIKL